MHTFNKEITKLMKDNGAALVGFADLYGISELPYGVCVAVALPREIVKGIHSGPTTEYYDAYHSINAQLDGLVTLAAEYLKAKGYAARAQSTTIVDQTADYRTALPHKTVATRAGLGWIGRCALLVTREYGSAVRISSLVTDALLTCATPVDASSCGKCNECVTYCPANAVTGAIWDVSTDREVMFDAFKCRETARELSWQRLEKDITICGKCIEVCPYTQRYLARGIDNGAK